MSATDARPALLRIGDVARLVGTTARTIRYYEEKGLLPPAEGRAAGKHRLYDRQEVERLGELLRMRNLLGVPLEELRELVAVDDERTVLRSELHRTQAPAERARILRRLDALAERQLAAVERRTAELDALRDEIAARRARIAGLLAEVTPGGGSRSQRALRRRTASAAEQPARAASVTRLRSAPSRSPGTR